MGLASNLLFDTCFCDAVAQAPSNKQIPSQHSPRKEDNPGTQENHSTAPVQEIHLSQYAVEQLTAAGVSSQLLQLIQSSPQPCTTPLQVPSTAKHADSQVPNHTVSLPHTSSSAQHATGKGTSSSSSSNVKVSISINNSSSVNGSSSKAEFRKKAHLLRVRQEHVLDRIRRLCTDEAHSSSSGNSGNSSSSRGNSRVAGNAKTALQWQRLAPQLQVVCDVAVILLAQFASVSMLATCSTKFWQYKHHFFWVKHKF